MAAPNAPNPAIPNVQGNPDQKSRSDQDQVPADQVPAQVPIQPVPQLAPAPLAPAGVIPVPQIVYQNWIVRNQNSQVSQKKMRNLIFLVQEIGWKHITSQKEKR